MNHNYRLVWNALNECWVVTHEHARGRGKQGRSRRVIAGAVAAALVGLASPAASVFALPVGEQVTQGSGTVSRAGNTLNVNQTSQRLAINWSSFNIGASETVNFVQPNASAVALNRVLGSDPSQIYGKLNANGQVFLINPNGILFGQSAQVNVGGLVASSLNLSDSDFMAGKSTFSGAGSSITNLGSVTAKAGGYVAFLGGQVSNQGTLVAHLGTVALAAGNQVSLDFAGDKLISVQVDQGTLNALAENKQLIQADGGTVILSAKTADALVSAVVNNTGIIQAQTVEDHAGTIRLLGDMEYGITKVSGTLDASAPGSGDGGFIETSAATVKIADSAKITTKSALGKNGKWLIDPVDFTIGTDITGATLSSQLGSGDVEIQSSTGHSGSAGNINVNDTVSWSANTLTLNAYNNININSVMNGSGTAKLALKYGQGAVSAGNTSTYNVNAAVNLSDGDNFSTQKGSDGDTVTYHVISSLSDLQNVDLSSSNNYALGHNIDATDTASWNSGAGFQPLNSTTWTGTLDGLGHTVSHLTINRPTEDVVGPFQNMASTATLKNIGFTDVNITGRDYTGGIAGIIQNSATVYNSYTSGSVSGRDNVGGIAGIIQYWPTIDHNYSSANVSAASNGGGLVGITYLANITNSHASGNVTSINTDMDGDHGMNFGGLVGYQVQSSITGSYATGNVFSASSTAGNGRLGGLVGRMDDSQITNSYATGYVDARAYGGDYGYDSGGLVGLSLRGVVNACFATGQVSGRSTLGGLMGISNSGSIDNSYATGRVTGIDTVGGFIGRNRGTISNSYSTGEARAASGDYLGQFAGDNPGSINNSVYSTTTPGSDWGAGGGDNSGISGYDATSLKQASNFSAWDLSNTWVIFEGQSSPLLRGLMKQLTVTTNDVSKTYDARTLSGTPSVTYSSAFDASDLTGTLTYSDAGASATNAGRYALNTTGLANTKFSQLESYNITYVASTLTINKAHLEVSTSNVSKTYDGTTNAAGSLVAVNGTQLYGSDSLSGGAFAFTDKNAGTGNKTVTVSSASINDSNGGGNYDVTYVDNTTSTITPKAITQTGLSVASSKVYDGTAAAIVIGTAALGTEAAGAGNSVDGNAYSGDSIALSGTAVGTYNSKNVASASSVSFSGLSLTGTDAANYTLTLQAPVAATITPKAITQTGLSVASSKVYDSSTSAVVTGTATFATESTGSGNSSDGKAYSGDSIALSGTAVGTYNSKNVASASSVSFSGLSLTGGDAGNYTLTTQAPASATITQRTLTATATANNKVYDGTTAAAVTLGDNRVLGDTLTLSDTGASFADKNAATGKTVTVSGVSLSGADAGNYTLASHTLSTTADITPKTLTISGSTAANKLEDGSTSATVTAGLLSGLLGSETLGVSATGNFNNAAAGENKPVTVGYTLADGSHGGLAQNYSLANQTLYATITPNPALSQSTSPVTVPLNAVQLEMKMLTPLFLPPKPEPTSFKSNFVAAVTGVQQISELRLTIIGLNTPDGLTP